MGDFLLNFNELVPYLIVCPLAAIAGFVDAIAGGGGLITIPAYLIAGIPPHLALGTNKIMSGLGTSVATWRYMRAGYINFTLALCCVPFAFIGSALGSDLTLQLSSGYLKVLLLFLLPGSAIFLSRKHVLREGDGKATFPHMILAGVLTSLLIGIYDGFYGPGTGVFLILSLTFFARMKITQANGLTKIINLATDLAGACVFIWHGSALIQLGLIAALFNIAGNYAGSSFFKSKGVEGCRKIMLLVIAIFMVRVIYDLLCDGI